MLNVPQTFDFDIKIFLWQRPENFASVVGGAHAATVQVLLCTQHFRAAAAACFCASNEYPRVIM
jgi:hypothetical protein